MSRYASKARWNKEQPGSYLSPCGQYRALNEGYSRWMLVLVGAEKVHGPFAALADCQDQAQRMESRKA